MLLLLLLLSCIDSRFAMFCVANSLLTRWLLLLLLLLFLQLFLFLTSCSFLLLLFLVPPPPSCSFYSFYSSLFLQLEHHPNTIALHEASCTRPESSIGGNTALPHRLFALSNVEKQSKVGGVLSLFLSTECSSPKQFTRGRSCISIQLSVNRPANHCRLICVILSIFCP